MTFCVKGGPTVLSVSMPLDQQHGGVLAELAERMLQEWARTKVNAAKEADDIGNTFTLDRVVPPDIIIQTWCKIPSISVPNASQNGGDQVFSKGFNTWSKTEREGSCGDARHHQR